MSLTGTTTTSRVQFMIDLRSVRTRGGHAVRRRQRFRAAPVRGLSSVVGADGRVSTRIIDQLSCRPVHRFPARPPDKPADQRSAMVTVWVASLPCTFAPPLSGGIAVAVTAA